MVGRWISFWDGPISGAMLVSGRVNEDEICWITTGQWLENYFPFGARSIFRGATLVRCSVSFRKDSSPSTPISRRHRSTVSSSVHHGWNKIRKKSGEHQQHMSKKTQHLFKKLFLLMLISGILLSTIYTYGSSNTCTNIYIYMYWLDICTHTY